MRLTSRIRHAHVWHASRLRGSFRPHLPWTWKPWASATTDPKEAALSVADRACIQENRREPSGDVQTFGSERRRSATLRHESGSSAYAVSAIRGSGRHSGDSPAVRGRCTNGAQAASERFGDGSPTVPRGTAPRPFDGYAELSFAHDDGRRTDGSLRYSPEHSGGE